MRINDTALKYIKSFLIVYLFVFSLLFLGSVFFLLFRGYSNHSEQPSFTLTREENSLILEKDTNMSALITTLARAEKQKESLTQIAIFDGAVNPQITFDIFELNSWTKFLGYSHIYYLRPSTFQDSSTSDHIYFFLMNNLHLMDFFGTHSEETIAIYLQKGKIKYDIILKEGIVIE